MVSSQWYHPIANEIRLDRTNRSRENNPCEITQPKSANNWRRRRKSSLRFAEIRLTLCHSREGGFVNGIPRELALCEGSCAFVWKLCFRDGAARPAYNVHLACPASRRKTRMAPHGREYFQKMTERESNTQTGSDRSEKFGPPWSLAGSQGFFLLRGLKHNFECRETHPLNHACLLAKSTPSPESNVLILIVSQSPGTGRLPMYFETIFRERLSVNVSARLSYSTKVVEARFP